MATWDEFAKSAPEMAEAGRRLLYQYGPGLGFLATVRADGGPRLHPVCPVIADGGLYAFIVPSPKRGDLRRDGRFALHSFPAEATDDEFCVTGTAGLVTDPDIKEAAGSAYHDEVRNEWVLFHLGIERVLHSAYRFRGDWPPTYSKWRDPNGR